MFCIYRYNILMCGNNAQHACFKVNLEQTIDISSVTVMQILCAKLNNVNIRDLLMSKSLRLHGMNFFWHIGFFRNILSNFYIFLCPVQLLFCSYSLNGPDYTRYSLLFAFHSLAAAHSCLDFALGGCWKSSQLNELCI